MKKDYVRPTMVGERFVANEYVAACGDKGTEYLFQCNAGGGKKGGVWKETNGISGLQTEGYYDVKTRKWIYADDMVSTSSHSFHACNITHNASTKDDFFGGYYLKDGDSINKALEVTIWLGADKDNVHCTPGLGTSTWETVKS